MLISFLSLGCSGHHDDLMLSAVCTLAFYGFLWCGEFTVTSTVAYRPLRHLCMDDVILYPEFAHPAYMTIPFKYPKTDPFRKGHVVTLHATKTISCPFKAMSRYLQTRIYESQCSLFLFADGTSCPHSQQVHFLLTFSARKDRDEG